MPPRSRAEIARRDRAPRSRRSTTQVRARAVRLMAAGSERSELSAFTAPASFVAPTAHEETLQVRAVPSRRFPTATGEEAPCTHCRIAASARSPGPCAARCRLSQRFLSATGAEDARVDASEGADGIRRRRRRRGRRLSDRGTLEDDASAMRADAWPALAASGVGMAADGARHSRGLLQTDSACQNVYDSRGLAPAEPRPRAPRAAGACPDPRACPPAFGLGEVGGSAS